jgi:uncharacterized membrane protein HdeD (DUF308 family)
MLEEVSMRESVLPASEIKSRAGWSVFAGVLIIVLGVFLLAYPFLAAVATVLTLGIILGAVAIVELVLALRFRSAGDFFVKLLSAFLYGITAFVLLAYPVSGVAGLTLFVGSMFLVQGIIAGMLGFKAEKSIRGWLLLDAAVTLLLSFLILAHWPSSSVWAIGTLMGVAFIMRGVTRIATSLAVRHTADVIEERFRPAA